MDKRILLGSIIAVVILVLVSFSSVVAKVSTEDELVEFDVEFSGLGKKHKVKLTQQEASKFELLFDDIEQRLSEVETREEAEYIYKEAIVELDKYGLLGRFSVKQTQEIIFGKYKESYKYEIQHDNLFYNEIHNSNCLVLGKNLICTKFYPSSSIHDRLIEIFNEIYREKGLEEAYAFLRRAYFIYNWMPIKSDYNIGFGAAGGIPGIYEYDYPALGTVFTNGAEGIRFITGDISGTLGRIYPYHLNPTDKCGVRGFTGIRILNWYIGSAEEVGLKRGK